MESDVPIEGGWVLEPPDDVDVDTLMGWFPDAAAVARWGGPRIRYPFSSASFREDCRIDEITSYCLRNPSGAMMGFGQIYDRYDRAHLARLISHPGMRRQGLGERLIRMIMRVAHLKSGHTQSSLFVYKNNEPAYRCYLKMGFVVQDYPDDAPLRDQCYFLTCRNDITVAS